MVTYKETTAHTIDAAGTEAFGEKFAQSIGKGSVVALCGALGAGKTTFVRGMAKALTPESVSLVHSPTFTIVNEYKGEDISIFHFDFYRLKDCDDLYSCGFDDYFDENGVIVAEWADMFMQDLPADTIIVSIEKEGENERKITVKTPV